MRWSASHRGWFGKTRSGVVIFVPEAIYQERLRMYLAGRGIELKTWTAIMIPVEEAWQRQCAAVQTFQADLDHWLTCKDPRVKVLSLGGA